MNAKDEPVLSCLLSEIKDKSLQMILRGVIFSDKPLLEIIKSERVEYLNKDAFIKGIFENLTVKPNEKHILFYKKKK